MMNSHPETSSSTKLAVAQSSAERTSDISCLPRFTEKKHNFEIKMMQSSSVNNATDAEDPNVPCTTTGS